MEFTALQDFFSPETQSHYSAGLSYTARAADDYPLDAMPEKRAAEVKARCEALARLLPQWVKEGKVMPGRPAAARVKGA